MTRLKRFLTFFLAGLMVFPMAVLAKPASAEGEYVRYKILDAKDMLSLLIGAPVGEEEAEFLDRFYEGEIIYNSAIPGGLITVADGSATAGGYTTQTTLGQTIFWTPEGAILMNGGVAEATYRGALTISKAEANRLLNFVYDAAADAAAAESEIAEFDQKKIERQNYLEELSRHESEQTAFNRYKNWEKNKYNPWVVKYQNNKAAWDAYDAYMIEKERFDQAYAVWEADHAAWQAEKKQHDDAKKAHETYLINAGKINSALLPVESMFIDYGNWDGSTYGLDDEIGVRSLYEALQNEELVTMLLDNKGLLQKYDNKKYNDDYFKKLEQTSAELKGLLRQYAEKRENSQKEAFLFYKENYTAIRDKFNDLYGKMTEVFNNPTIYASMCVVIEEKFGNLAPYKKWRIKNVLCQIYVVSQCIDDQSTRKGNWSFYKDDGDPKDYTYAELLNQEQILTDSNKADPSALTWQDVEPEIPVLRSEPVKPIPTYSDAPRPTEARMSESSAPKYDREIPSDPGDSPAFVEEPSPVPQERYEALRRCEDILAVYKSGELSHRASFEEDATVYLSETVCRRYDIETGNSAESIYNEKGELSSEEEVATEWEGGGKTYVLLGFMEDSDGLCFYPIYEIEDQVFEVVFFSEGEEILRQKYAYGQTPKPNLTPTKEATNTHTYTFGGWSPVLSPVKGNAAYEAVFSAADRLYTVTFRFRTETDGTEKEVERSAFYFWDAQPTIPETIEGYIDGIYRYVFCGWDQSVSPVTGDAVYTALYEKNVLVEIPGESEDLEGPEDPEVPENPEDPEAPPEEPEGNEPPPTDMPTVSDDGFSYLVESNKNTVGCENLIQISALEEKTMTFRFSAENVVLAIDLDAVRSLCVKQVKRVQLITVGESDKRSVALEERRVGVAFYDKNGERVYPDGYMTLTIPARTVSEGRLCLCRYGADGTTEVLGNVRPQNGAFVFAADAASTYGTVRLYTVTVQAGDVEKTYEAEAGAWIPLALTPPLHHQVDSMILIRGEETEGVKLEIADGFTMPQYDGVLTVTFSEILYRIEFRYHGGSEIKEYRYGEVIVPPTIPLSMIEEGICYNFIGWNDSIGIVTEEKIFDAIYEILTEEEIADDEEGSSLMGLVRRWLIPLVIILLPWAVLALLSGVGFIAGIVGLVNLIKYVRKRKKTE